MPCGGYYYSVNDKMTSFYGTATLCEVKYNSVNDECHTPYRISCWSAGARDNVLTPDIPVFNLPSSCSVSYYEYLRSLYEGKAPASSRLPGYASSSTSTGNQSSKSHAVVYPSNSYASKHGYIRRRPKTAITLPRSESPGVPPQQQKSLPSILHHETEEEEELYDDDEFTLFEDKIVWVDALNKWVPEQQAQNKKMQQKINHERQSSVTEPPKTGLDFIQIKGQQMTTPRTFAEQNGELLDDVLQPKPYLSFVGTAPTVAKLYSTLKENLEDGDVTQRECDRYNRHMESYKTSGLKEYPLHPDYSYANRLTNLKKREEMRRRAEEMMEQRRQRKSHTSPTQSLLSEKKQKVRFRVASKKESTSVDETPVPVIEEDNVTTPTKDEGDVDSGKSDEMEAGDDVFSPPADSDSKESLPNIKDEVSDSLPVSPLSEVTIDSFKFEDKKDDIDTSVTLPPLKTEPPVSSKKKVRELEVFMDFVDCYDDPVISDRDSPPTILQEPTVLQEEIIELPCAKPTPITNQKPKILSKTTADVKKKKTIKERVKPLPTPKIPVTVKSSKSLVKITSKTSKKSMTAVKDKSEKLRPIQKKHKTVSKVTEADNNLKIPNVDNFITETLINSSELNLKMEDSEHLPHQNEVMKTTKSNKIRHHKSVKPVKLPAATSTRSPQNKVPKQVSSRCVDVKTLPRSFACLEAPPTQMTLSASNLGHKIDSVIEEKEFLDIEIESGVRVCVTDFSDPETVSPCNFQTFNPRGVEVLQPIPTVGDTKTGPLELKSSPKRAGTPREKKEFVPSAERRQSILRKERYELQRLLKERSLGSPTSDQDFQSPTPSDEEVEEESKDELSHHNLVVSRPHVCIDEPALPDPFKEKEKKHKSRRGTLVTIPKFPTQKLKLGRFRRDTSYEDELRKFELAEKRRQKQMEMLEKLKTKRHHHDIDVDDDDDSPNFEDYGFLAKYCIFNKGHLQTYKYTFDIVDDEHKGWLTPVEVMMALRGVNNKLTDAEEEYLYRILELTGYSITKGADFKLFSVLAALSQKISSLDNWMRNQIGKMDFQMLEMKTFMCKTLWECNVDHETNKISLEQLCVELRAGGISLEHEDEVRRTLSHLHALDLLDFLTYIPLFIMIHESVVDNPLDTSRDK